MIETLYETSERVFKNSFPSQLKHVIEPNLRPFEDLGIDTKSSIDIFAHSWMKVNESNSEDNELREYLDDMNLSHSHISFFDFFCL